MRGDRQVDEPPRSVVARCLVQAEVMVATAQRNPGRRYRLRTLQPSEAPETRVVCFPRSGGPTGAGFVVRRKAGAHFQVRSDPADRVSDVLNGLGYATHTAHPPAGVTSIEAAFAGKHGTGATDRG